MNGLVFRTLEEDEVEEARQLSNRTPDVFAAHALARLPCFFEIADLFVTVPVFIAKQRIMLGPFHGQRLIGVVFVSAIHRLAELGSTDVDWNPVLARFSEHEAQVFCTLAADWSKLLIGAPDGSLSLHTLCVALEYRGRRIATKLISEAITLLSDDERSSLYIEVARISSHLRMCKSAGFQIVRKSLSLSARLHFGCWGSALFIIGLLQHARRQADSDCETLPWRYGARCGALLLCRW